MLRRGRKNGRFFKNYLYRLLTYKRINVVLFWEGFVVGYLTESGETKPILTFEEMKNILYPDGNIPATAPINSAGKNENTGKNDDTKKAEDTEVSLKKFFGGQNCMLEIRYIVTIS